MMGMLELVGDSTERDPGPYLAPVGWNLPLGAKGRHCRCLTVEQTCSRLCVEKMLTAYVKEPVSESRKGGERYS